jgi:two-component system LytT family response regulator
VVNKLTQEKEEAFKVAEQLKLDLFYNESNESKHGLYQENLIVNAGHASIPLLINDIAYVYSMPDSCLIKTFDGKEYTSRSSLESLETLMNPNIFFRINRQMLAHARSIKKIKPEKYGELEVEFTPPFQQAVFISKKKATQFKQWLGKEI